MAIKLITNLILIIGLAIIQISFLSGLPSIFSSLNLALVVLIFILGFAGFDLAIYWALGLGFILVIFSFLPFGSYLVSLSLTIIVANFLLNYFFTNRSLYTFLALTGLATIIYELIIIMGGFIFLETNQLALTGNGNFLETYAARIGVNLLVAFVIFYIIHFIGKNLRPVFLIKSKK